jgi:hypothetical protein
VPRPTKLKQAEPAIVDTFATCGKRVFGYPDLRDALRQCRFAWGLKATTTLPELIQFIERSEHFKTHKMISEAYSRTVIRYSIEDVSIHELALSLRPTSYLSHGTAAELHNLLKPTGKTIYANSEQSPKPAPTGPILQASIDAAFKRKQKGTGLLYKYKAAAIVALNGKQTGQLGVKTTKGSLGEFLSVTNLERTLIDIAVRPAYAGGANNVLKAYRAARDKVSADKIVATLSALQHRYPFHQSIGFLMSRAGFPAAECAKLAALGADCDFYVDYDIKELAYSKEWRLYYPANLPRA